MVRYWLLAGSLAVLSPASAAQVVQDDFSDGDFTNNPTWTGDVDRFIVHPTDTLNWLRNDGLADHDTLHLATASAVAHGYWRFRFRHEVSLSNVNGSRIYLVASQPDLKGEVFGYYVQFGTNNTNRLELFRQDGPARQQLGATGALMPGLENTVLVEVTRDESSRWTVWLNEKPVLWNITDATYQTSAALGVWVRHNATGRDRFYWTDFLADPDPGDISPPYPITVLPLGNGSGLFVEFDKALDPATVTPEAFTVPTGPGHPVTATVTDSPTLVRLDFFPAIPAGNHTLTVEGVADQSGNVQHGTSIGFTVTIDTEPPNLVSATPIDATTVRVLFDEPVFGCDVDLYGITPDVGAPVAIGCDAFDRYDLVLGSPLTPQTIYVVTATGVPDLAGNVQPETSATFFFGEYDVAEERDVVINEIMYAPSDLPSNEYVEIYNRTADRVVDLSTLRFANATSPLRMITEHATPLEPGGYVVLVRNPEAFEARWPGVGYVHVSGFPALLNSGDTVRLVREDGTEIDAVPYRPSWGGAGAALERRDPDGPSFFGGNWGSAQQPPGGTPGGVNSIHEPDELPPVPGAPVASNDGLRLDVPFNEPLDATTVVPSSFSIGGGPDVIGADYHDGDFVARLTLQPALTPGDHVLHVHGVADFVGNVANESVAFTFQPDLDPPVVVEVRVLDASTLRVRYDEAVDSLSASAPANYVVSGGIGQVASAVWAPETPDRVQLTLPLPLEGPAHYTLTVRDVADLHGNVLDQQVVPFFFGTPEPPDAHDLVVNEVMYAPPAVASNEWVELYNHTDKVFDLAEFTLGDQTSQVSISGEPYLVPPGGFAVLVRNPAAFEESFPGVPYLAVPGFPVLLNSGDAVVLRHVAGAAAVTIDSVFYRPAWGGQGVSLERRSPGGPSNSPTNWASSLAPAGGTPGAANSVPPDTFPPNPVLVEVAPHGRSLTVYFDEPLEPATVVPAHFSLSGTGSPASAEYVELPEPAAVLELAGPLETGTHTLTVDGVADLLGNVASGATITFEWAPDLAPPGIVSVVALDELTARVRFSKAVEEASATGTSAYVISEGVGHPVEVAFAPEGDASVVDLAVGVTFMTGVLYELTVSGVADPLGNVQHGASAYFILGEGDEPAPGDVAINEIMFRPAEGGTEYVELFNASACIFDLSRLTISNESAPRQITAHPYLLPPGGYVAIARNLESLVDRFGDDGRAVQMANLPSLRNTGDAVVLRFEGATIDSVYYNPAWHRPELRDDRGVALERLDAAITAIDSGNWTSSLDPRGGTPGAANSVSLAPGEPPSEPGMTISPSPFDASEGTVVRFRLASEAGLVRIRVFDGAGRHVRTLEHARLGGSSVEGEVIWNGRSDRGESLPVGIYIVVLEAVDLAGARTEAYRAPVVLARRW